MAGAATGRRVRAVRSTGPTRRQRSRRGLRRRQDPPEDPRQPVLHGRRPHPRRQVGRAQRRGGGVASRRVALEVEVRPPWPNRLPGERWGKRPVMRAAGGSSHACSTWMASRSWCAPPSGATGRSACGRRASRPNAGGWQSSECASRWASTTTIARCTTAFGRIACLARRFRRRPWHRPRRRPWAWEALAWAITKQLIESSRAARDPAAHGVSLGVAGEGARRGRRYGTCRRLSWSPDAPRPSSPRWTWRRPGRWP